MLPKNRKIKGEKYKRMNLSIKRHRSFISLRFQDDVIIFKKKKKKNNKTIICIKPLWEAGPATKKSKTKDGPVAGKRRRRRSYDYCYYIHIYKKVIVVILRYYYTHILL